MRRLRWANLSITLVNFFSTDGGISTVSIEWMTPLLAIASGPVTLAFVPTVTVPRLRKLCKISGVLFAYLWIPFRQRVLPSRTLMDNFDFWRVSSDPPSSRPALNHVPRATWYSKTWRRIGGLSTRCLTTSAGNFENALKTKNIIIVTVKALEIEKRTHQLERKGWKVL